MLFQKSGILLYIMGMYLSWQLLLLATTATIIIITHVKHCIYH